MELIKSMDGIITTEKNQGEYIINLYLNSLKSKNTKRSYERSIRNFFKYVYGDKEITLDDMVINPFVAQEYANTCSNLLRRRQIKSSTYNSAIKGIKSFYNWLIMQTTSNTHGFRLLEINPFESVSTVSEYDRDGSDYLTPEEVLYMLNNPLGKTIHLQTRNALMLELAITTGIRCEAICNLTEENIQKIGSDTCIVSLDKGSKLTKKPINNIYNRLMEWYNRDLKIRTSNNGTIFNIGKDYANQLIILWANKLNINKKITFHSLRITTAIQIYHSTRDKYTVQKFLNHSTGNTTDVYLEKEDTIMYHGEDLIMDIKGIDFAKSKLENLSKEDLIALISSADIQTQKEILSMI